MSIDDLKGLMEGFDPATLLPELSPLLEKLAGLVRFAVMAGPIVLLVLGLLYLFVAPREANYYFGYRCYFGMGSVNAWRFSQRLAGLVWGALGLVLTVVMFFVTMRFSAMETTPMLWLAFKCAIWEVALAVASSLFINIVTAMCYDAKGELRNRKTV